MSRPRHTGRAEPKLLEQLYDLATSKALGESRVVGSDEFEARMRLALAIWRVLEAQKPESFH